MAVAADQELATGAVVREEEDQGVLEGAHAAKLIQHPADLPVHAVDHGGMDGHLRRLKLALPGRQPAPGKGPGHLAGTQRSQGFRKFPDRPHAGFHFREPAGDDAHLPDPPPTIPANFIPVAAIPLPVAGDVRGQGVEGKVGRGEGQVVQEGPAAEFRGMLLEDPDGMIGDGGRGVVAAAGLDGRQFAIVLPVDLGIEEPSLVAQVVGPVESAGHRHPVDVPLPRVVGAVPEGPEHIGKQAGPGRTFALASTGDARQLVASHLLGVVTGQQGGPSGPAPRRVVELGETQAAPGQSVQVRRLDLAPVAPEIGKPQVIGQDDHDVGTVAGLGEDE